MTDIFTPGVIAATLRIAPPLLFAAIGAAVCLKVGLFNIALEGLMLVSAFLAVVLATLLRSALGGVALTVLISTSLALAFGWVAISLKADPIIAGLGFNMLMSGLTAWLLQAVFQSPGGYSNAATPILPALEVAALKEHPILAQIFLNQDILTYLVWPVAVIAYVFVHQSAFGLRLRATGEHPAAAQTAGIRTVFWQYLAVALSGMLCGLGGAAISLSSLRLFTKDMTAGRGFIAFAGATFASGDILGTTAVTALFAFFGAVAIRLEGHGLPTHFVQMVPYVVTLLALMAARRRRR